MPEVQAGKHQKKQQEHAAKKWQHGQRPPPLPPLPPLDLSSSLSPHPLPRAAVVSVVRVCVCGSRRVQLCCLSPLLPHLFLVPPPSFASSHLLLTSSLCARFVSLPVRPPRLRARTCPVSAPLRVLSPDARTTVLVPHPSVRAPASRGALLSHRGLPRVRLPPAPPCLSPVSPRGAARARGPSVALAFTPRALRVAPRRLSPHLLGVCPGCVCRGAPPTTDTDAFVAFVAASR